MKHTARLGNATYSAEYAPSIPGTVRFAAPTQAARELCIPEDLVLRVAEEIRARHTLERLAR